MSSQKRLGRLAVALSLAAGLSCLFAGSALGGAAVPQLAQPDGIISNAIACLAINSGALGTPSGTLQFSWSGPAQSARLVLSAAGTAAAQPVKVNGQAVGSVPAGAEGVACGLGQAVYID